MHTVHRSTLPVYVDSKAKFPHFSLPMLVGYFSLDSERQFHADTSQLRYVYFPRHNENLAWDLNVGLENVQRADDSKRDEGIDHLLRGIMASGISLKPEVAGFVCFRGLLTTIMTTPYEQSQGWEILVSKFKGILYMCARETEEKRRQRTAEDEGQKRFSSWGFKFEQYLMTETPNQEPDIQKPVKEGEEFCCIFRTKLNNHRILFGAEMDGVRSKEPLPNMLNDLAQAEFMELKTSRRFDTMRQERNFKRYKLLKWWAQSFLVGIKNIVCGFRDDNGVVDNIRFYPLQEIPKMAKDMWVPAVCMTFLDQFLTFVETTVNNSYDKNDPHTVWRFRWEPGVQVVTVDEFPGQSNFSFLPEWFLSTTPTVDHHPLNSFASPSTLSHSTEHSLSSSFVSASLPAEPILPNAPSAADRGSSLMQTPSPVDSSTLPIASTLDHASPQEFMTPSPSHDPFFSNSYLLASGASCDSVLQQSFLTTSADMNSSPSYLTNSSSVDSQSFPSTTCVNSQSYLNSGSKSHSSYTYLQPSNYNLSSHSNHVALTNSSSSLYVPASSASSDLYIPSSSTNLSCNSEFSTSPSSSYLASTDPSNQFMISNTAVDQLSQAFLPNDRISTSMFIPTSEHLPPHM